VAYLLCSRKDGFVCSVSCLIMPLARLLYRNLVNRQGFFCNLPSSFFRKGFSREGPLESW